jgi:hypothetical protein
MIKSIRTHSAEWFFESVDLSALTPYSFPKPRPTPGQVSGHDLSVQPDAKHSERGLRSRAEKTRINSFLAPQARAQLLPASRGPQHARFSRVGAKPDLGSMGRIAAKRALKK